MYIAIICDNAAERKQLERLLEHTLENLKGNYNDLYVDSFGNAIPVLDVPMKYGLFILAMDDFSESAKIIHSLIDADAIGQFALCMERDDTISLSEFPQEILMLLKPFRQLDFDEVVLKAVWTLSQLNAGGKVELRGKDITIYASLDDIIYVECKETSCNVYLTDGKIITIAGLPEDFYNNTLTNERYVYFRKDLIINSNHVKKVEKRSITLDNQAYFTLPLFAKNPFY